MTLPVGVDGPEEVEMSVHCDVVVFSWLLDYVKSSRSYPAISKVRSEQRLVTWVNQRDVGEPA